MTSRGERKTIRFMTTHTYEWAAQKVRELIDRLKRLIAEGVRL